MVRDGLAGEQEDDTFVDLLIYHPCFNIHGPYLGTWDSPGAGYKKKANCVTHSDRSDKERKSFTFRSDLLTG